jgi:predicted HD superfamily hydrolase involved in NAD metabolism
LGGSDEDLLARAALLHDVGKEMVAAGLHEATEKGWISVGKELLKTPGLAHAALSAAYAKHQFGVHEPRALLAIAYHPTGHPDFDHLGLALFLADYLEPTRTFENKRKHLLTLAKQEPYQAALEVLKDKFYYVRLKGREIHPVALAFEQSLRQHLHRDP